MASTIIGTAPGATFGQMTNTTISRLINTHSAIARLKEAIATASAGYSGVSGTEFEAPLPGVNMMTPNLFGVQPDPAAAGAKGSDYAYAVNSLAAVWETFWEAAVPFIDQLDNGTGTP